MTGKGWLWIVGVIVVGVAAYWMGMQQGNDFAYKSVLSQTLHYFSRPHEGLPAVLQPFDLKAAWKGSDLQNHPEEWLYTFSENDRKELLVAMEQLMSLHNGSDTNLVLANLKVKEFPLPTIGPKIAAWRKELSEKGKGFQVLRGVPIEHWSENQVKAFFWLLGKHIGITGAQVELRYV